MFSKLRKKGQAAVEYAVLLVAILIVSIAAISLLGHKTADLWATAAVIIPGGHAGDNGPIFSGELIEITDAVAGGDPIVVALDDILANTGENRIDLNVFDSQWGLPSGTVAAGTYEALVVERP